MTAGRVRLVRLHESPPEPYPAYEVFVGEHAVGVVERYVYSFGDRRGGDMRGWLHDKNPHDAFDTRHEAVADLLRRAGASSNSPAARGVQAQRAR